MRPARGRTRKYQQRQAGWHWVAGTCALLSRCSSDELLCGRTPGGCFTFNYLHSHLHFTFASVNDAAIKHH